MMKLLCRMGLLYLLGFAIIPSVHAQKMDICNLYGTVYLTDDPKEADFVVYQEEREAFADLVVFKEENKLFADQKGLWFFTEAIDFAKYVIFISKNRDHADFSIYYTETPSFAGCR